MKISSMPFVSVTRLRVRSLFYLIPFLRANEASVKALKRSEGLIKGKELMDKQLTFWTITLWADEASMKAFRGSPAHRKAMQHLPRWCNEASYHHWIQDDHALPDWPAIAEKLFADGKRSKVRHPSASQLNNQFPPVQWQKTERLLK